MPWRNTGTRTALMSFLVNVMRPQCGDLTNCDFIDGDHGAAAYASRGADGDAVKRRYGGMIKQARRRSSPARTADHQTRSADPSG